ncbi:MAG: hypothetical protein KAS32_12300 [Candidatus Peribacteraceae bacterium]|nr:hypothetical protein [Candidatus Peribacteraceae bacterium]
MKELTKNEQRKKVIEVLNRLRSSINELHELEQELNLKDQVFLENNYPFEKDLDCMKIEVNYWVDYHTNYLIKS